VLRTPDSPLADTVPAEREPNVHDFLRYTSGIGTNFDAYYKAGVFDTTDSLRRRQPESRPFHLLGRRGQHFAPPMVSVTTFQNSLRVTAGQHGRGRGCRTTGVFGRGRLHGVRARSNGSCLSPGRDVSDALWHWGHSGSRPKNQRTRQCL